MPNETLQERLLTILKEAGERGTHLSELYARFPANLKQSIRGTVLSLVRKGRAERLDEGVYRATR